MQVLVVEDDIAIQEAIKEILEVSGYRVTVASGGLEALELLGKRNIPSVILLDLMMPVMDGWQFIDKVVEDRKLARIPIVITSAAVVAGQQTKYSNVREVLKKPVSVDQLLEVIGRYCAPNFEMQVQ